ncbi:MAG: hypothetical protein FJ387_21860 [Verrucomicrobia bacterium]|nr:hypothetical protein [Verrucomicrobiota bacterium]
MNVTNLVLVSLLSYCTDFAKKLDLSVDLPLTTNQVRRFALIEAYPRLRADLLLSNEHAFSFAMGQVSYYRGPLSVQSTDREALLAHWTQLRQMGKEEVVVFGRRCLDQLGYSLESLFADLEPEVEETGAYPNYVLRWNDPTGEDDLSVEIEIDAANRKLVRLFLLGAYGQPRPEPWVPGLEELARQHKEALLKRNPGLRREYVTENDGRLLKGLAAVEQFAGKLELPVPRPLAGVHVREAYEQWLWIEPQMIIVLTNGYWFRQDVASGRILQFHDGQPFFSSRGGVLLRDYAGEWKLSEAGAIGLVGATLRKLGLELQDLLRQQPYMRRPEVRGNVVIPRLFVSWARRRESGQMEGVGAEVDCDKGRVAMLMLP